jgi:exodeoxyribonuclease VII large subunit
MEATESKQALTVSEITAQIKDLIEKSFGSVWVTGEISNFRRYSSGHCYFTLKDAGAQLQCVMWRSTAARVSFSVEDGMQVLARGVLSVYEVRGQYQLVVGYLQPAGIGALQQAFEELKNKLAAEGLFAPERKRPIPQWPSVVGVVTSGTGAAVRDIITVISRRMPTTRLIIRPTLVQGAGAAEDIVEAIRELNEHGEAEVLIVGRGGGSLEDLWAFNEEPVVRAIVGSKTPVVSAVGHEIDFTLADFAADVRAATPSAAAEMVVPSAQEIRGVVAGLHRELLARLNERIEDAAERFRDAWSPDVFRRIQDRIDRSSQDIDRLTESMGRKAERIAALRVARLRQLTARLDALSPLKVLSRGYAVCEHDRDGQVITDVSQVNERDRFRVRLQRGIILGIVEARMG